MNSRIWKENFQWIFSDLGSSDKVPEAKHIFSHIEWHMTGYEVTVDELEKTNEEGFLFIHPEQIKKEYSIPSAFEKYTEYAGIRSK